MTWFYKHPSGDAYYNDVEESACAWLRELMIAGEIAPGVVDNRSILDVQPTDLIGFVQCHFFAGIGGWSLALRLAGWPDNRPVWTGSPPCQPFSVAGEGKGKDDERHLAPKFISLVRACRPRVLFGEQVASSAVFGKAAKGRRGAPASAPEWAWIDDLSDRLEAARYAAWSVDFPSAGVGAPHIRQRTYFGAVDTFWLGNPDQTRRQPEQNVTGGNGKGVEQGRGVAIKPSKTSRHASGLADAERIERQRGWASETVHEPGSVERTERLCNVGGVADAASPRSLPGAQPGVHRGEEGAGSRNGEPERCGANGGVVNGVITGLEGQRRDGDDRHEPGRLDQGAAGSAAEAGAIDGVADADGATGRKNAGGTPCDENAHGAAGRNRGEPDTDHRFASDGENCRTGAPDSFWSDPDWLFCRDGKWRPVEPGTFPLANGVPGRVGLLRGYGNAINPQQAAVFIEESAQALAKAGPLRVTYEMTTDSLEVFG